MKHLKILIITIILLCIPIKLQAKEEVTLYLFHLSTCPHCAEEKIALKEIQQKYDNLTIKMYEVSTIENDEMYQKVKAAFNSKSNGVPFTVIGETYIIGYNSRTKEQIIELIDRYSNKKHCDIAGEALGFTTCDRSQIPDEENKNEDKTIILPVLGKINPQNVSLPLIAIIIGTIDGFNPCAMWILLFLISMLLGMNNKKRMWALGLTFLGTSALVYMLFMMAWLQIAISFNQIIWIRTIIAIIALIGGAFNLKSYFKSLKKENGCEIVDDNKRTKIFTKIKKFTTEKSFIIALLGIATLAISVNLIELACSAGLPVIFTQILSLNELSSLQYFIYILIYIIFFLIDDIIVFGIAMKTFQVTGVTTKYSKYSHLVGGILMILIGILLILKPEWLMFNFK